MTRTSVVIRRLGLVGLLVLQSADSGAVAATAKEMPGLCRFEEKETDKQEARTRQEAECLARVPGLAKRDGKILELATESGAPVRFENGDDNCDTFEKCAFYSLRNYFPALKLYAVHVGYYEGHEWIVVEQRTGQQYRMPEEPHLSPAGRSIASVSPSEGHNWNGIEIWSVTSSGLSRVLRFAPFTHTLYKYKTWDGEDRLKLNATMFASSSARELEADVNRKGGVWRVRHIKQPRLECLGQFFGTTPQPSPIHIADEKASLVHAGNTVARTGDTLRIRTRQGHRLTFQDGSCGTGCVYRFSQRFESNGVNLVRRTQHDGSQAIILVDERSGVQAEVAGEPFFALDGKTFAVVAGNTVEVWFAEQDGIKRLFGSEDDQRYCFAGWDGTDRLMLQAARPIPGGTEYINFDVIREGETWKLQARSRSE